MYKYSYPVDGTKYFHSTLFAIGEIESGVCQIDFIFLLIVFNKGTATLEGPDGDIMSVIGSVPPSETSST